MSAQAQASPASRLADEVSKRAADVVAALVVEPPPPTANPRRPEFTPLDATVWSLARITRNAVGPETEREMFARIGRLDEDVWALEDAFVAWVSAVEELVQVAEWAYRGRRRAGPLKACAVRASVDALIADGALGRLPPAVRSWLAGPLCDWTVDGLVLMINDYGLWADEHDLPLDEDLRRPGLRRRALDALRRTLARFRARASVLAARASERLAPRPPRPGLLDAVGAGSVDMSGLETPLTGVPATLRWFGSRREELVASLELVFSAVQCAESETSLSGPEKRDRALDLILDVLDDQRPEGLPGGLRVPVELFAGWLVEAAVRVFARRGAVATGGAAPARVQVR